MISLEVGKAAKEKGLSIQDLADIAGIAYNTAKSLYRGHTTRIDFPTLERVCLALDIKHPGTLFVMTPDEDMVQTIESKKVEEAQLVVASV